MNKSKKEAVRSVFPHARLMRDESSAESLRDTYAVILANGQPLHALGLAASEADAWEMACDALGIR